MIRRQSSKSCTPPDPSEALETTGFRLWGPLCLIREKQSGATTKCRLQWQVPSITHAITEARAVVICGCRCQEPAPIPIPPTQVPGQLPNSAGRQSRLAAKKLAKARTRVGRLKP